MKLNYRRTILVGLAFMSISAFWQMYDSVVPLILSNTFDLNEGLTGAIMAIDNVLALFLLPVFGTLSDKVKTPIDKRTPFIIVGTALTVIGMFFMPKADNAENLLMFMIMTGMVLLAMSLFRSPAVALMPDVTPRPLRSKGNAIINLTGTVGAIYALVMIKVVVGPGLRPDYTNLFLSMIIFMVVCTVLLAFTVHENKWERIAKETEEAAGISHEEEVNVGKGKGSHLPSDKRKSLIFLLLSVCFWYMAYNAVTTAFSRYATAVWGLEEGGFADCLLTATIAAIVGYIPIGLLANKIGRKKSIIIGVIMLIAGFAYVGLFSSFSWPINLGFVVIGVGWAAINVNSFPMVVEIATDGDVGKYTGFYYTFSMAAQVITPTLSGFLLEVDYRILFPYAAFFSILALITMLNVHHGDVKPLKKKSILENLDVDD